MTQGDCIISPCRKDKDGYPRVKWHGKIWPVSRVIWTLMFGDIPEGILVCHDCDNTSCVNPSHLYLGSFEDNMHDKVKRNRVVGNRNPNVKIVDEDIPLIKALYRDAGMSQQSIADKFGVAQSCISGIITGRRRKYYAK